MEDGPFVTAAGVTSGFDGALRVAARLRGAEIAQGIQLYMQYDPEPPYTAGSPGKAPPTVLQTAQAAFSPVVAKREAALRQIAATLPANS